MKMIAKKCNNPIRTPSKISEDIPGCGPGAKVGAAKLKT